MTVLLITYDLMKPGQDYSDFLDVIKSYNYTKLSESSYAINTTENIKTVYEKLNKYRDKNDNVYIIGLCSPHQGYGPKTTNQWLSDNL
jgi:hypothetical protein